MGLAVNLGSVGGPLVDHNRLVGHSFPKYCLWPPLLVSNEALQESFIKQPAIMKADLDDN
ncbi:unnamed protein product [Clavelina lepadiformis]|uniref:Uncharacterized protein n=1 Tax=Clavelina lepadiformis TaxID=159417 RepID=A0ABP0GA86_CLALP